MHRHIEYFIKCVGKGESLPLPAFMAGDSICRRISARNALKYIKLIIRKIKSKDILNTWLNMSQKKDFKLKAKTKYEITCSFIDKYQQIDRTQEPLNANRINNHPLLRLQLFTTWLEKKYLPRFNNCNYEFYLELSDPQRLDERKYSRLHLHGIISFDNEYELLKWKLNDSYNLSKYGNIQLNDYRPNYWLKYCTKDYKKNLLVIEEFNSSNKNNKKSEYNIKNDDLNKIKFYYKKMEKLDIKFE